MRIGMSSSCFYPEETELSLRRIGEAGAKTVEIFFNSPGELRGDLLRELCAIRDHYGMEIVSVIGLLYDSNAEVVFEDLTKEHPEVPVVVSDQPYEFVNQVKTYKPDIVLCHANGLAEPAKLGVVTVPEFDVGGAYFGYNGVFQVARQLVFALENHSYVTEVSKHVKFPYKQSWYEKDPFAYLKD